MNDHLESVRKTLREIPAELREWEALAEKMKGVIESQDKEITSLQARVAELERDMRHIAATGTTLENAQRRASAALEADK